MVGELGRRSLPGGWLQHTRGRRWSRPALAYRLCHPV